MKFLASDEKQTNVYLYKMPSTEMIIIRAVKSAYSLNPTKDGFQFERFLTEGPHEDYRTTYNTIRHLRQGQIGKFNVLYRAEVDAVSPLEDNAIAEIKKSCLKKQFFPNFLQMLTNGSSHLFHGHGHRHDNKKQITRIEFKNLVQLFNGCDKISNRQDKIDMVKRITEKLQKIVDLMKEKEEGKTFHVYYENNETDVCKFKLSGPYNHYFPPSEVIEELME